MIVVLNEAALEERVEVYRPIGLPTLALRDVQPIVDDLIHLCAQPIPAPVVGAGCQPAKLQRDRDLAIVPHGVCKKV
jgi:hypothetical protein